MNALRFIAVLPTLGEVDFSAATHERARVIFARLAAGEQGEGVSELYRLEDHVGRVLVGSIEA